MSIDPWLPRGFTLAVGVTNAEPLFAGNGWQILASREGPRVLAVEPSLFDRWVSSDLVKDGTFSAVHFGDLFLHVLVSGPYSILAPVSDCRSPNTKSEASTFAAAFRATRKLDADSPLQDALYVEDLCRLLPTYSITTRVDDDVVLGYWLTGGAGISVKSFRRLSQMMSWLGRDNLRDVIGAAGLGYSSGGAIALETPRTDEQENEDTQVDENGRSRGDSAGLPAGAFELPGRPELAAFFNEHVVDIVRNRERYKALVSDFHRRSFCVDRLDAARPSPSSVWWNISVGQVLRSTHPVLPVPTSTTPAKKLRRCSTRPWRALHPC